MLQLRDDVDTSCRRVETVESVVAGAYPYTGVPVGVQGAYDIVAQGVPSWVRAQGMEGAALGAHQVRPSVGAAHPHIPGGIPEYVAYGLGAQCTGLEGVAGEQHVLSAAPVVYAEAELGAYPDQGIAVAFHAFHDGPGQVLQLDAADASLLAEEESLSPGSQPPAVLSSRNYIGNKAVESYSVPDSCKAGVRIVFHKLQRLFVCSQEQLSVPVAVAEEAEGLSVYGRVLKAAAGAVVYERFRTGADQVSARGYLQHILYRMDSGQVHAAEAAGIPVETGDAVGTAGPHRPFPIGEHPVDIVALHRVHVVAAIAVNIHVIAVVAVHSSLCREPHIALSVLADRRDRVAGKALFHAYVAETECGRVRQRGQQYVQE